LSRLGSKYKKKNMEELFSMKQNGGVNQYDGFQQIYFGKIPVNQRHKVFGFTRTLSMRVNLDRF
jgi:hypothetical protein